MPERALGPGHHRVVVGDDGAGGPLVVEEVAVDPGGAAEQAVAGGVGDQVVELAAAALGGDREAAVLDEAAGVDEVGEVLAGGAPAGGVAALDRGGPSGVLGQRPAGEQLGEVGALGRRLGGGRRGRALGARPVGRAGPLAVPTSVAFEQTGEAAEPLALARRMKARESERQDPFGARRL